MFSVQPGRSAPAERSVGVTRRRQLPPIWLVLAACAVLASVAVYVWPWLRDVLTASPPHRYPWWFVTALFVHVDRSVVPLYLHLVTNVAVIVVFGREAERRLGSARLFVLVVSAVAAQLAASVAMGRYGDGTSGIAWAFAPLALASLVVHVRARGTAVLRSARWWIAVALLLWIWVVVTIASLNLQMHSTNVWHLVATLVGAGFVVVWRRRLFALDPPAQGRWDVRARVAALAIPLLIGGVLLATALDVVAVRSPATAVVSPASGAIGALADAGGRIEVRFDVPMVPNARTRTTVVTVVEAPVRVRSQWADDRTFVFQVSRSLVAGEALRIEIDRLADADGRPFTETIRLTYE